MRRQNLRGFLREHLERGGEILPRVRGGREAPKRPRGSAVGGNQRVDARDAHADATAPGARGDVREQRVLIRDGRAHRQTQGNDRGTGVGVGGETRDSARERRVAKRGGRRLRPLHEPGLGGDAADGVSRGGGQVRRQRRAEHVAGAHEPLVRHHARVAGAKSTNRGTRVFERRRDDVDGLGVDAEVLGETAAGRAHRAE